MILRILCLALALAALLTIAPHAALAQYRGGMYMGSSDNPVGPTVSPYLNLAQGSTSGLDTITNYQSLVRPLINQGNAIRRQGSAINSLQQQSYPGGGGSRTTGHPTFFMNYSHYYPSF